MGFRNPFRIQVDSDDVAYVTDYSPDSSVPGALRGPQGTGRMEVVRKPANYGWPVCMSPTLPMYEWDFNTSTTLGAPYECGNPNRGPINASRHNTGRLYPPAITQPDLWYSFQDPTWGTPCFDGYNTATVKPCPLLFPELGSGGVGPHGAAKYEFDPANANPTKFPPYYDDAIFFGEFTRDTLKEIRLDSNQRILKINSLLNCGAVGSPAQPFECDNPMDMQFGADGHFYLLTYGDGFFAANADAGMYKWEYVKGTRAPRAVLTTDRTNGQAPLTVKFSSAGSNDPDPADSLRFAWDFGDGTSSSDQNPTHTYTANGVYTARLTVTDSTGKTDIQSTVITVGNTAPTVTINTPLDGDFFEWGDDVPYTVTVTDPEDGPVNCARVTVTFVLVHDTHGHAEDSKTGCSGVLQTFAEDASHGGYIAGGISATYTDLGANGQPALSTTDQNIVQVRRQQVEYAQEQNGTGTANAPGFEPDPGGGQIRNSLNDGDWIALNNLVNLTNMNKEITFRFAGGAGNNPAGEARINVEIRDGSPTGPLLTTATLQSTGSTNTYSSQTFPLNYTGSKRLYLVVRQIAGGATAGGGGFGNLNWVEFSGAGAGVPAP
jgi:PKD repeat protein